MQSKILPLIALAAGAVADFQVVCGTYANILDGAGLGVVCQFFDDGTAPFSCDDLTRVRHAHQNDVSGCGGLRCEGCNIADSIDEWTIEELEYNDDQSCLASTRYWGGTSGDAHFTIYNDNGSVTIRGTEGNSYGYCYPTSSAELLDCTTVEGPSGYYHFFTCYSELYYLNP